MTDWGAGCNRHIAWNIGEGVGRLLECEILQLRGECGFDLSTIETL